MRRRCIPRPPFSVIAQFHCTQCRKASGAEFATNATVEAANFKLAIRSELMRSFESSPGNHCHFCGQCGSPVYKMLDIKPELIRNRLGLLDFGQDFPGVVQGRAFTSQKLSLSGIPTDAEPCFKTVPGAD